MSEFAPPWRKVKMSKSQVKKYIKDLEKKRQIAKQRLEEAKKSWAFEKEAQDLRIIENIIDNL